MQAQTTTSPQHWKTVTETLLRPVLNSQRIGLITDMDGTISLIAETPEAAVVTPRNRELLSTLVLMLPLVAAISGRAARDLQSRIAIPGMVYIGNHGLEHWGDGGRVLNENVRHYRRALCAALDELRPHLTVGMRIEDKYATAALHYRLTPDPEKAAQHLAPIVREIAKKHGLEMAPGRRLLELRPPLSINKGTTLLQLVKDHRLDAVVYLGDDISDVDALKAVRTLRETSTCYGIGIGVAHEDSPHIEQIHVWADAYGTSVVDIEEFLEWLLKELSQKHT
jgi:trehalose 6-phosphate phosphatase